MRGAARKDRVVNMSASVMIAISEARLKCEGEPDVLERLRKAMRETCDHWMETNDQERFRAAIAAAVVESNEVDRENITKAFQNMVKMAAFLNAVIQGVPVDLDKMLADKPTEELLPLRQLWDEVKAEKKP